jgi:conjugal transfer pilus assembly protein TraW
MRKTSLIFLSCFICSSLWAKDLGTYGSTFAISEINMIDLIKDTLIQKKKDGQLAKLEQQFKNTVQKEVLTPKAVDLGTTTKPKLFEYIPTYTVSNDIKDANGLMLYPKGTTFNPLDVKTYPKRIRYYYSNINYTTILVFFDGRDNRQLNFVKSLLLDLNKKHKAYKLIMTGGNIADTSKYLNQRVYFDQNGKLSSQMHLQHVPTVVYQSGTHFNLQEYSVQRFSARLNNVK